VQTQHKVRDRADQSPRSPPICRPAVRKRRSQNCVLPLEPCAASWGWCDRHISYLAPTTYRTTLWDEDFEASTGFHQTGRPFFRTPNTVLQERHSYTWSSSSPRRWLITASTCRLLHAGHFTAIIC